MSSRIFNLLCVKINSSQKFSKSIYLMGFFKKKCVFAESTLFNILFRVLFRIFIFEGFEIINCLYLVCLSRLKSEFLSSFRGSFLKTHFSRYF